MAARPHDLKVSGIHVTPQRATKQDSAFTLRTTNVRAVVLAWDAKPAKVFALQTTIKCLVSALVLCIDVVRTHTFNIEVWHEKSFNRPHRSKKSRPGKRAHSLTHRLIQTRFTMIATYPSPAKRCPQDSQVAMLSALGFPDTGLNFHRSSLTHFPHSSC